MIEFLHSSIYWCVLQVSAIALAGIVASIIIARRSPAAACSITCVTVAAAAMLTSLAPLPVHRSFSLVTANTDLSSNIVSQDASPHSTPTRTSVPSRHDRSEAATLDLSRFAATIQSLMARVELRAQRDHATAKVFAWCFGVMVAVGLTRLACGIGFVLRTRRLSAQVSERRVELMLKEIVSQVRCLVAPAIRASEHLSSAAVAGWFRPTLILPKGWEQWSDEELRSVIAHEVAHIVRRDSCWRAIASCVSAMHFYNPLVHWLLRRVLLYQELAADELAAAVVGRRCYLRSLSKLAIRRDDLIRCNGRPDLMPVFSGHLMRRIKMLRSRDGNPLKIDAKQRAIWSAVASTAIITLGVAAIAVRGFAEPPTKSDKDPDKPAVRVARARTLESATPNSDSAENLFLRQPLAPTTIAPNNTGMIVVCVRELLELPELKPYVALFNESLPQLIESEILGTDVGPIDLGAIEWIAGQATMTTRNVITGPDEEKKGAVFYDSPPPAEAVSELEKVAAELSRNLHVRCHNIALGFDVTPDGASLGVRLRLSHAGRGPATKSAQDISEFIKLIKENPNDEPDLTDDDRGWLDMWGLAMENVEVATEGLGDGSADVVLTSTLPFERVVSLYANLITQKFFCCNHRRICCGGNGGELAFSCRTSTLFS